MDKSLSERMTLNVGADLFYGYELVVPYPEWKQLVEADADLETSREERVAAFERYDKEHGPVRFYVEEEFDEKGEENDDYDPYLWIRPAGESAEERWREITLEEAVDWSERYNDTSCRLVADRKITPESLKAAVSAFRKNPYWRGIYDNAPIRARKVLVLRFWASENASLVDGCEEEFNDLVAEARQKLKVADLEYLIANKGHGGAACMAAKKYEELLKVAKEREALKGVNASGLLRELKKAYRDWEANRIGDKEYNDIAHRCQGLFERLGDIGRVSEGMYDKFEAEYTANMYAVNE